MPRFIGKLVRVSDQGPGMIWALRDGQAAGLPLDISELSGPVDQLGEQMVSVQGEVRTAGTGDVRNVRVLVATHIRQLGEHP
jgi:hypothetical protein